MSKEANDIHIAMFAMNMADSDEDRTSWTQETLANLERCYERRPFRLTIVDNGSTCGRWRDYLNRYDPPMIHAIIRYRENQGLCWPENLISLSAVSH